MFPNMKYFTTIIFVLSISIINGAPVADSKTEFSNEFGAALKTYHAEMTQGALDNFIVFYESIVSKFKSDEEIQRVFTMRKSQAQHLKTLVGDSITVEALRRTKSKINTFLFEIFAGLRYIQDEELRKAIKDGINVLNEKEQAGVRLFKQKLQTKWHDMYKNLTEEDRQNHAEYVELNDYMEANTDDFQDLLNNVAQIWLISAEFFGFEEYKEIFKKRVP